MGKRIRWLLIAMLGLFTPAVWRAQGFTEVVPASFTGFLSHPNYDAGGWYVGVDFLFVHGPAGDWPDSILSLGYRTDGRHRLSIHWWSQWFNTSTLNQEGIPDQGTKLEIIDFTVRFVTSQTDNYRSFITLGPRFVLYSQDLLDPIVGLANYNVDNNMFGIFIGSVHESRIADNPLGTFSFTLEGEAGLYVDDVRQAAGLGAFGSTVSNSFNFAGSLQGKMGFICIPWEAVSIHAGVDVLWLLNAQAGHQPQFVDGGVTASLTSVWPWYVGFYLGFGFVF